MKDKSDVFTIKKKICKNNILIKIFSIKFYSNSHSNNEKIIFFGFPVYSNLSNITSETINESREEILGYYLRISEFNSSIEISNDILGNFRLYYYVDNNTIIISDEYKYILNKIKPSKLKILSNEYNFYTIHRYCLGDKTFIKNIKKLPPCTTLRIDNKGETSLENNFKTIRNISNQKKHSSMFLTNIVDSFKKLKIYNSKKILFFSGGYDSLLLVGILKKLEIKFIPIFIKCIPFYKANFDDYHKAKNSAYNLNLELKVINIEIKNLDKSFLNEIADEILFDRHFAILHFLAIKEIKSIYGDDIIIINGQGSDSVLSFGPSEKQISSFLKRFLIYNPSHPISKIIAKIVSKKYNSTFSINQDEKDYYISFLDEKDYWFLKNTLLDKSYSDFLHYTINELLSLKDDWEDSFLMYLKIFGFLQGSDNQVVIKSATYFGINKVFLPFSSPKIIYSTIKYKNNFKELISPKYVVKDGLSKLNIKYQQSKLINNDYIFFDINKLEKEINLIYYNKIRGIK